MNGLDIFLLRGKYTGLAPDDPLLADPKVKRFHDDIVARVNFVEEMERLMGDRKW